jgi:hypothetical protein
MAPARARSTVGVTMNATATDTRADGGRTRRRPTDRVPRRREPPPRGTTAPARPGNGPHADDGSHTAPHGDAVLPHTSARRT